MDASTGDLLVKLISTLGFPIVMCLIMVWINREQSKRHAEESAKWISALENNTLAMNKIYEVVANCEKR